MRPLVQIKRNNLEVSGVEFHLDRIATALEEIVKHLAIGHPQIIPGQDFDPDDFSSVSYSNEEEELIQQHLDKRVGGFVVEDLDGPGLY